MPTRTPITSTCIKTVSAPSISTDPIQFPMTAEQPAYRKKNNIKYRSSNKLLTDNAANYAVACSGGCECATIIGTINRYDTDIKYDNNCCDPRSTKVLKADLVPNVMFSVI